MTATEILASVVSIISVIVSIVSIVFAVISWTISHQVNERMLEIEEKREQDRLAEQNTGKVKIVMTRDSMQFFVYNEGAIGITITDIILNKISIFNHPFFQSHHFPQNGIKIPVDNHYPITMTYVPGVKPDCCPPYDTIVKLVTDNGDEQQIKMTINWM